MNHGMFVRCSQQSTPGKSISASFKGTSLINEFFVLAKPKPSINQGKGKHEMHVSGFHAISKTMLELYNLLSSRRLSICTKESMAKTVLQTSFKSLIMNLGNFKVDLRAPKVSNKFSI